MPDKPRLRTVGAVCLLLAGFAAAGGAQILRHELWLDEAHSAYLAQLSVTDLWTAVTGDVHPPLYFVALNGWARLVGDSVFALCIFSLVCTVGAVISLWRTASWDGEVAGLMGVALLAFSPAVLLHAVEVRMYALGVFTLALMLGAVRRAHMRPTYLNGALAGVFGAATVYTHYVAAFTIAGLFGAWLVVALREPRIRSCVCVAALVCGVVTAPWLPSVLLQRERKLNQTLLASQARALPTALAFGIPQREPETGRARAVALLENTASVIGAYPARSPVLLLALALPFLVLGVLAVLGLLRRDTWLTLLGASGVATFAGTWLLGLSSRRYLLFLAPLGVLAMIRAVAVTEDARLRLAGSATLVVALAVTAAGSARLLATSPPTPVGELMKVLRAEAGPGDRLLFHAPYGQVLFDYYAIKEGIGLARSGFPETTTEWWARQPFQGWGSSVPTNRHLEEAVMRLREATQSSGDLWLVLFEDQQIDPGRRVRSRLEQEGVVERRWISSDSSWEAWRLHGEPPTGNAPDR